MAWNDLDDLETRVRERLNEETAAFFPSATIRQWINMGQVDVACKTFCLEGIQSGLSTTIGSRIITPDDAVQFLGVEYVPDVGVPYSLVKINPLQFGRMIDTSINIPQCWVPWGNTISIDPKPKKIYTINVYRAEPPESEMTEDEDSPEIPDYAIPLIIDFAVNMGLLRDNLYGRSSLLMRSYYQSIMAIRSKILSKYTNIPEDAYIPESIRHNQ